MSARAPHSVQRPAHAGRHETFSYLDPSLRHDQDAQFTAIVKDFASGIGLCLEMINTSVLAREMNEHEEEQVDVPLLDKLDTERLLRFANASADMLARHAEDRIEWMNKYRAKRKSLGREAN